MRLRLGLLQDPAAIDKQIAREASEAAQAQARKARNAEIPTVKTESQTKTDEAAVATAGTSSKEREKTADKAKHAAAPHRPRIRPLSEAKAIDSGANFISETFLFGVGLGCVLFETWRSRRKEKGRREDVAERLAELEGRERNMTGRIGELVEEIEKLRAGQRKDIRRTRLGWLSDQGKERSDRSERVVGEGRTLEKTAKASNNVWKPKLEGNVQLSRPLQSTLDPKPNEGSN